MEFSVRHYLDYHGSVVVNGERILTIMWIKRCFHYVSLLLCLLVYSGCASDPYTPTDNARSSQGDQIKQVVNGDVAVLDESDQASMDSNIKVTENITSSETETSSFEKNLEPESSDPNSYATDQELIDAAFAYCQASNDFWEQGELDNAIDALDKAYSLSLQINGSNVDILQQREDLRITISKRIIEVYSSRFTVANGSHKAIPLDMNKHVENALALFKGKERGFFLESYSRSGRYRSAIVRALKEAGLPEELSWLPLIESGFKVKAMSKARALGMWQFIASTGYKYGLKRDTYIDERMDPEKSTKAAISYLTELHNIFGDWITVLAAYNCGEMRVLKIINNQKLNYLDNFWDLYERLPNETASYVPRFLAVLHILNNPREHGFNLPTPEAEIEYEYVTISKQVQLKTIAERLEIDTNDLKELNPELRQDITPKTTYTLKVPNGKGELLLAKLDTIPTYNPPAATYVQHRVRSGESLSVIAERYKTSVRAIMNMNGLKNKDYLKVGWRLKIPTGRGFSSSLISTSSYTGSGKGTSEYVVKKGDSLWKIANRYNTTVNAIKDLNGLRSSTLQIGQVLILSPGITASGSLNTREYIVKEGDSPYLIARRNQMNLYDFLDLNNLTPQSTIYPGQRVQILAE
jgi:membrane-bound lytic murein transglycosylase D